MLQRQFGRTVERLFALLCTHTACATVALGLTSIAAASVVERPRTRALSVVPGDQVIASLVDLNSASYYRAYDLESALQALEQRGDLFGDDYRALASALQCRAHIGSGNLAAAGDACERSLAAAERDGSDAALFSAHRQNGRLDLERNAVDEGINHLLAALRHAEALDNDSAVVVVYSAFAHLAQGQSAFDQAAYFLEKAMARARDIDDPTTTALVANNLGGLFLLKQEPESAVRPYAVALAAADDIPQGSLPFAIRAGAALTRGRTGDPHGARDDLRELLAGADSQVSRMWRAIAQQYLAEMQFETGDPVGAHRTVSSAIDVLQVAPARMQPALLLCARIQLQLNRPTRALAFVDALIELSAQSPAMLERAYEVKARALEQQDQPHDAIRALRTAMEVHHQADQAAANHELKIAQARFEVDDLQRNLVAAAKSNQAQQRWTYTLAGLTAMSAIVLMFTIIQFRRYQRLQAQVDAKFRLEALGQLTGGVAHDFNNLLTAIRQSIDLLRLERLDSRATEVLDGADQATHSAGALVRQLLDFARGRDSSLQELKLDEYLRGNQPLLQRTAGDTITFDLECEQDLTVRTDPDLLRSVLINLVANARDAIEGAGEIIVSAKREREAEHSQAVTITVRDSGRGIAAHQLMRVFEPFFTTKAEGEGTGLGLSTAFGLVKAWGGEIDLESETGSGTVVTLRLRGI